MATAGTPAAAGLRMPAETGAHERTLMGWPCRTELWGTELPRAKDEYAGVANTVAAFEPVTMVCSTAADAADARAACSAAVEIVELPLNDSWLRDHGPVYVTGADGARAAVCFGFNAWGERFTPWDADAALGARLAERAGDPVHTAPLILEGGSIAVDGRGTVVTTEQCLLHPNRNPSLSREQIEGHLLDFLGGDRVVWLDRGLVEDRDTDGHVDLIAAFTVDGRLVLQSRPPGDPDHEPMAENRERALAAGLAVEDFEPLARAEVAGDAVGLGYLNLYLANGVAVVPQAGDPEMDAAGLARVAELWPEREVVGVPALTIAYGGGGPHCITQQVPARI